VVDGLKGSPEAIGIVFPQIGVQTCIVHLARHSLSFVSWQDRKRLLSALKAIYQAENHTTARCRLDEYDGQWGANIPRLPPPGGENGRK
jgi:putative transposase